MTSQVVERARPLTGHYGQLGVKGLNVVNLRSIQKIILTKHYQIIRTCTSSQRSRGRN